MFLCPKCSYSFNIGKNKSTSEQIEIKKINNLFTILDKNLDAYELKFSQDKLKKNKKFKNLDQVMQKKILSMYKKKKSVSIGANFICTNCNFTEPITSSVKLYEIRKDKETLKKLTDYELQFYIADPTYPKTKDYSCKNINCITHKNKDLKKAIFFKKNHTTYNLSYVCTVCSYLWEV